MTNDSLYQFAEKISRLMPDITRAFLRRQVEDVARGNISIPQMLILDILKDKEFARMKEVAKYLAVTMAAATGIADNLVKNGLVFRSGSPDDRRVVNIGITVKGRKAVLGYNRARAKGIMEIFSSLNAADRDKYLEILMKLRDNLRKNE